MPQEDHSDSEAQPLKSLVGEDGPKKNVAQAKKAAAPPTNAKIGSVVAFYWVVSLSLVFLNKAVMSTKFPYPAFVTWVQLCCQLALVVGLGWLESKNKWGTGIPAPEFNFEIAKQVMPLSIIYVLLITLTNYCLKHVEISFYQLVKSLTIIFNVVLQRTMLGQPSSHPVIMACIVVVMGFVVGSIGEVHFSLMGTVFGVASSLVQCLYGIYIKKMLPVVNNNEWKLVLYNSALAIALLFPICVVTGEIFGVLATPGIYVLSFWNGLLLSGVFGFLINIAIFLQIKYTSPLTGAISGTAKACVQTFMGVLIYQNPITPMNLIGLLLSLTGSGAYSKIKYHENQAKKKAAAAAAAQQQSQA